MNLCARRRGLLGKQEAATVHGTWEDLFRCIDAGTYATDYAVGETLPLDLGETFGSINMEISNFNADTLSNGSGNAAITMVAKELLLKSHRWNPAVEGNATDGYTEGTGGIGGWAKSELRAYYQNNIYPEIPELVRSRIAEVKKNSFCMLSDGTATAASQTFDKVFAPSARECGRASIFETAYYGGAYSSLNNGTKRMRTKPGSQTVIRFWLRTGINNQPGNAYSPRASDGSITTGVTTAVTNANGLLLCFCIN